MAARRVSLPAADDLFRPTAQPSEPAAADAKPVRAVPDQAPERSAEPATPTKRAPKSAAKSAAKAEPSGRIRHDEKMTVYITSEELLAIEHARLLLRGEHGLVVDRGRLVREAVAMVLAEFEEHGTDSALVRRLSGE